MKSAKLFYREGTSDKLYNISLEEKDGGYVVNFAFGRRGDPLRPGTKTEEPLTLEKADKIYESLLKKQRGKGYDFVVTGNDITSIPQCKPDDSGVRCQLLNPIEGTEEEIEAQVEKLMKDDRYVMQEKHDSERRLIKKTAGALLGINRKGILVPLREEFDPLKNEPHFYLIDGEEMDGYLYVWDALEVNGRDLRKLPYRLRLGELKKICDASKSGVILYSGTYFTENEKREAYNEIRTRRGEGVVFKLIDAPSTPGRPNTGGSQLKRKFYHTASFIVKGKNPAKRSISIGVLNDTGGLIDAGNVTIPANHVIPNEGDIVEVRYLYAYKQSGSVFQPVYLGVRNDIERGECLASQLKYKSTPNEEE